MRIQQQILWHSADKLLMSYYQHSEMKLKKKNGDDKFNGKKKFHHI